MRQPVLLMKEDRRDLIRLALSFVMSFCLLGMASKCPAIQEFYGLDNLTTSRVIDEETVKDINETNKELGKDAPDLSVGEMLNGGNSYTLTVIDEQTERPLTEFVVHCVVLGRKAERYFPGGVPKMIGAIERLIEEGKFKLVDEFVGVGRLESKRITDAAGQCRYDALGKLEVEFQVCAKGYVTQGMVVKIPEAGTSATMRLKKSGGIHGRMLGTDGSPLQQAQIELTYEDGDKGMHTHYRYETTTGTDGSYRITGLPPDNYILRFPDIPANNSHRRGKTDDRLREEARQFANGAWEPQARNRRSNELLTQPCPLLPIKESVEVPVGRDVDLGTIRLMAAPVLELQIVGEDGKPMVNCSFEISYPGHDGYYYSDLSRTDGDGKARLSLAGWRSGGDAVVYVPEKIDQQYQPKRLKRKPRGVLYLGRSDKEIYERERANEHQWGIEDDEEKLPGKYEDLTTEQKAHYHKWYEEQREDSRKREERAAARPDHPNYELFSPQEGKISNVHFVFKQPADSMNPRLIFRDRFSGEPVKEFRGVLSFNGCSEYLISDYDYGLTRTDQNSRIFHSLDRSGKISLKGLTLPQGFLEKEQRYLTALKSKESYNAGAYAADGRAAIVVDAPDYVRQAFAVTTSQLRSGEELVFELEPEARVIGRVLIGETGEPLNKDTLKALLVRQNKWNERLEESGADLGMPCVHLENEMVEDGKRINSALYNYAHFALGRIGFDGRFEVRGLRPYDQWGLVVSADEIPQYTRTGLTLKPGTNDLGDIKVGGEGQLVLQVNDEQGNPLAGVYLHWPLGLGSHSRFSESEDEEPVTNAAGELTFGLLPLQNDRQILRLVPPWGFDELKVDPERNNPRIKYDAVMPLDRNVGKTIETRLERGHTLRIELNHTPALEALVSAFQKRITPVYSPNQSVPSFLAIRNVFLQSLEPNPEGFVYHQSYTLQHGIALTSPTTVIEVDDVPPGRYALSLVGSAFVQPENIEKYGAYPDKEGMPLAYTELEMAPSATTVALEVNPVDVEIELEDPSAQTSQMGYDTVVYMDRTEPLSTAFGGDLRRTLASIPSLIGMPAEEIITPMVGYCDVISHKERHNEAGYRPIVFHTVPAGTYRVEVFDTLDDARAQPPRPCFVKNIQVDHNGQKILITVPYRAGK